MSVYCSMIYRTWVSLLVTYSRKNEPGSWSFQELPEIPHTLYYANTNHMVMIDEILYPEMSGKNYININNDIDVRELNEVIKKLNDLDNRVGG